MYTITATPGSGDYDWVQICPWFLEWAMKEEYPSMESIDRSISGAFMQKLAMKLAPLFLFEPIDMASLFEKVIIHEVNFQP